MTNNPTMTSTTVSQINNRINDTISAIDTRLENIESDNLATKAYIGTLRVRFQEVIDEIDLSEKLLAAIVIAMTVVSILINVYCFSFTANHDKDYISLAEIQSYDHSQLAMTDTDYYSWYDYDRATGKVYIVMRRDGDIIGVVDAYGKDGKPLYIGEEDE